MIVLSSVSKYYGARAAVSNLSFTIEKGEVIGLLGRNGAGKTTTLKILSGLLVPSSGDVHIAGLDMRVHPEAVRSRIGFLPEVPPLYREMTVYEYLTFVAAIKGVKKALRQAVDEAMVATDLQEVTKERIHTLSNGFQRRVGIAQAIVHRPALILLDEPTSGLDPVQILHMRKLIRALKERHTVLVSSHILGEIHELCDRIFVLQEGRIVAEGTEEDLRQKLKSSLRLLIEVRGTSETLKNVFSKEQALTTYHIENEKNGIVTAYVEMASDKREHLAKTMVEASLGLLRFENRELELENIFLLLTHEETPGKDPTKAHEKESLS